MNSALLAVGVMTICLLHPAESETWEWTLEDANRQWQPMARGMQHVGVPGCQWQAGVYWNGSIIIGQLLHRMTYIHPRMMEEVENAWLGDNLLHLSVGYGDPVKIPERIGISNANVSRGLIDGRLPIPWIEVREGDLVWHETVFAHLLGRSMDEGMKPRPDDVLVVECSFTVKNNGLAQKTASLWLHFGDTSRAPTYSAQLPDLAPSLPHTFAAPFGEMDDRVRYILPAPTAGELLWHESLKKTEATQSPAGKFIQWSVPLAPGEQANLRIAIPLGLVDQQTANEILRVDQSSARQEVVRFWRETINGPGQILTPDPYINDYLSAVSGQMTQQIAYRHKPDLWMYKTSPNWYEDYYPANAARALPVFDMKGLSRFTQPVLQSFLDFQSDDASGMMVDRTGGVVGALTGQQGLGGEGFERHPGFLGNFGLPVSAVPLGDPSQGWTANMSLMCHGAMLWSLAQHYRITRDEEWLGDGPGSRLQAMLDAFDWVTFQRERTKREENGQKVPHWGLLPPASAHDWLSGSTIFNDAWCILGMTELVHLLREKGHPRTDELKLELLDYRQCLRDRYSEAAGRSRPIPLSDGTHIPFVPRMVTELDWAGVDWTYIGYGPLRAGGLGALDPFDPLVDNALAFAEAGRPSGAGSSTRERFWRHYVEPETHWPLYELFLSRDDLPRFFELYFNNMTAAVHHNFRVGCEARDGVVSCAPGDAERWMMTRRMFINETGGYDGSPQSLWLLQAVPRSWLKPGCRMQIKEMRTTFGGVVSMDISMDIKGDMLTVDLNSSSFAVKPAQIKMRLRSGDGRPLKHATLNGRSLTVLEGDTVVLPDITSGFLRVSGSFGGL